MGRSRRVSDREKKELHTYEKRHSLQMEGNAPLKEQKKRSLVRGGGGEKREAHPASSNEKP